MMHVRLQGLCSTSSENIIVKKCVEPLAYIAHKHSVIAKNLAITFNIKQPWGYVCHLQRAVSTRDPSHHIPTTVSQETKEVNVELEDQQNINVFNRLNQRMHDIEAELAAIKVGGWAPWHPMCVLPWHTHTLCTHFVPLPETTGRL